MNIYLLIIASLSLSAIFSSCSEKKPFAKGTVVCVKMGGEWLQGYVESSAQEKVSVKFYDGFTSEISPAKIFLPNTFDSLERGDRVLALWKPGVFLEAKIIEIGIAGAQIEYETSVEKAFVEFSKIVKL